MAEVLKDKQTPATEPETVTLTINDNEVTVPKGTTVLDAAKSMGIHIPTFCNHPKLKPVGACRICYVEIEKMPKLQVSCATEAMNGMVVHTDSDLVKRGRKAVLEFTLINHPLDCPTCDKGGECDLQDLTFDHGYDDSRFDFQKMRHIDEADETTFDDHRIGPEIILNRNRCILCYKCVRANKEAFGEYDLGSYERGNITEINAAPGEQVDNPFSGNLVEICPVGALTNTDWRYKIRVWLTQTSSSIDPFHSSGTNILFYKENHQKKVFRVTSRANDQIDDGWLTDVTRYGYQMVNSPDRLKRPLVKKGGKQVEVSWEEALGTIRDKLTEIKEKKGCVCIGGLASPSLDNATLFSFSKLIRSTLESNNVDFRTDYRFLPSVETHNYDSLSGRSFKIADIDDSDLIISFGSDLIKEHPNEYLRIRKAYNFNQATVYSINPYRVKSADIARRELIYKPGTEEILINGLCLAALENGLVDTAAGDLRAKIEPSTAVEAAEACNIELNVLHEIAAALASSRKVTLLAGEIISHSRERETIAAALCNLVKLFNLSSKGQVAILPRYANSRGAQKLGLHPNPPDRLKEKLKSFWGDWPEAGPLTTDAMLINMKKEEVTGAILMGCNPVMLYPDREFAKDALEGLDFLVVADMFETDTTELADVVLPLSSWAEFDGQFVNLEGRSQQFFKALEPKFESKPGYEIVELIAESLDDQLFDDHAERNRQIKELLEFNLSTDFPAEFQEVKPKPAETHEQFTVPMFVGDDPHHSGHYTEKAESLTNFCGEAYVEISPDMAERLNLSNGDPVRLESEVGKIVAPVKISETIREDVVFVPRNFPTTKVNSLLMRKKRVDWVKISRIVD